MRCEKCGKNTANTVYQENINGKVTTTHLCADCAAQINMNSFFADMYKGWESVIGDFFGAAQPTLREDDSTACPTCGSRLSDLSGSAKIGCADCYTHFRQSLLPSIHRIHGKTNHMGKIPKSAGQAMLRSREIEDLKKRLNKAVEEQDFEQAAQLRDQINALEAQSNGTNE